VPQLPGGNVRTRWALDETWSRVDAEAECDGRRLVPLPYAYGSDTTLTLGSTPFNSFVRLVKPSLLNRTPGRLAWIYAGACRMHASPKFGMLDAWNRLHAVRNVVVADSSAFTTGPEKNPVLTAMTLAARGTDRLARDLHVGDL
jgi:choline dehydrogenase-like flavoprotein